MALRWLDVVCWLVTMLKTYMHSYLMEMNSNLASEIIQFHNSEDPEHWLFADAIRTTISCAGSINFVRLRKANLVPNHLNVLDKVVSKWFKAVFVYVLCTTLEHGLGKFISIMKHK